jgi:hypothetical protein
VRFRDEVRIWLLAEDMDVGHCVAARLISALSGSARRATISMPDTDLMPTVMAPGPGGAVGTTVDRAASNRTGVRNVMAKLELDLGQQKPERKGETLHEFFATNRYHRRSGERVTDWCTRFEEGLSKLKEDDIDLEKLPDVAGWQFLHKAGLTEERRERVLAKLPDEHFPLKEIRAIVVRLFPTIHHRERGAMQHPAQHARRDERFGNRGNHQTSGGQQRGKSRDAYAVEDDAVPVEAEAVEEHDDRDDNIEGDFQDAIRSELEGLSNELELAETDLGDVLGADGAQELESAAVSLAAASEALATVRNARAAIKGGGKGKREGGRSDRPAVAPNRSGGGGRGRGRGSSSSRSIADRIEERKKRSA